MKKRPSKSYTIRKVEANLKGMDNHITTGSDVGSEPFPFTEEKNQTKEQYHFGAIDSNRPL
ncbi:hypothetical protein GCM10008905_08000 [Clostridium malenominatum]|uniref:Uncharacterized protein n=1 Tax=Clostridium malenominatum TaxID=1539 RepID=A0ABP3U1D5_9CLOT